jgi:hypothetical protein
VPPLVTDAQNALREPSPLLLLELASGVIELTTPRPVDSWGPSRRERPDGPSLFQTFVTSEWPAMPALALGIATLHPDKHLAMRLRSSVIDVPRTSPWLMTMGLVDVTDTIVLDDPLGDGENLMLSWRWPDGHAATLVVYVDHNMGSVVKDAFVVPDGWAGVSKAYDRVGGADVSYRAIDAADLRARLEEAIRFGERVVPPLETESWPACRPLLEWLLASLPEDGTGFVRPDWPESRRAQLLDDFVASNHGAVDGLSRAQVRELAEPLVWFACDFGPGDPLRWSPVSVEVVLADWYARKVFGPSVDELRRVPDVLAGFVRFAHERTHIRRDLTDDTLNSIRSWRGDFDRSITRADRSPRDNAIRLARLAAAFDRGEELGDLDELDDDELDDLDFFGFGDEVLDLDDEALMALTVDQLEAAVLELVGGVDAYEALDDAPLGDRPFDWTGVPPDARDATAETLAHLDRWSLELFDREVRTIARAVLAGVVHADPGIFRRSARTDILAAAILAYLMRRIIDRSSLGERPDQAWKTYTQKGVSDATGLNSSSLSTRAATIAGIVDHQADIAWPSLLHSSERAAALSAKQLITSWRASHE